MRLKYLLTCSTFQALVVLALVRPFRQREGQRHKMYSLRYCIL